MKSRLPLFLFACCALLAAVVTLAPDSLFKASRAMPVREQKTVANPAAEKSSPAPLPPPIKTAPGPAPAGMVWIPGGSFQMGSPLPDDPTNPDRLKRDEFPVHSVTVDGFYMDETAVTNAEFARFVEATGYVTFAEIKPEREDFLGVVPDISQIPEENLVAGALVFNPDFDREKFRNDFQGWELQAWKYQPGANWKHPQGPGSSIAGRDDHPVVNVVYQDCLAYCRWAGKRLPTEAEWEYACRGGQAEQTYPWGEELTPAGKYLCNYWQGEFPVKHEVLDGFETTAPVKSFPANGYGLYDMAGNVWEWVNDYYRPDYYRISPERNPQGPERWLDPNEPTVEKRVTRGGSFLCNTNNCTGYRNAARMRSDVTSASFHTGFRCVVDSRLYQQHHTNP